MYIKLHLNLHRIRFEFDLEQSTADKMNIASSEMNPSILFLSFCLFKLSNKASCQSCKCQAVITR